MKVAEFVMLKLNLGRFIQFFRYGAVFTATVLAIPSCATEAPAEQSPTVQPVNTVDGTPAWLWDSRSSGDSLVFIAAGPRRSNRDEEKLGALKNAALQAGVFSGFWGSSQDFVLSSRHGVNFAERTRAFYDGEAMDAAMKDLKAEEIWVSAEGTWVKFRLKKSGIPPLNWQPESLGGRPTWINKPPEISGWLVAVGLGGQQSTLAKTVRKADEAALAELILQIHGANSTLTLEQTQSSATWSQTGTASAFYGKGFGNVRGFLVIARWHDESGAWSLAVCPREWNGK